MKKSLQTKNQLPAWQAAEVIAKQRLAALELFNRLKKRRSVAKSAAMVGASVPSLWRWQKRFAARGLAGLKPKPPSGGKPSPFSKIRFPVAAAREIERLTVATGSRRAAWRQFAGSPLCPPLAARHILKTGNVPACLAGLGRVNRVQAVCYTSADGRRLLVRLACKGTISAVLTVPAGFELSNPTKANR